jgi:hypothetical protein
MCIKYGLNVDLSAQDTIPLSILMKSGYVTLEQGAADIEGKDIVSKI